ncbi:ADP,ATP carrier protein 1 [Cucumispora dikerogammari]|nr:ADP,ATP carrier protein 1 [Cucumispora dikerogammari]
MPEQTNNSDNIPEYTEDDIERLAEDQSRRTYTFFPIAKPEYGKFFRFIGLIFCISLVYSSTREMKEYYIIEKMNPSIIAYIKLLLVTPTIVVVSIGVAVLLKHFELRSVFKAFILFFIAFFVVFGLILLPNRKSFEISQFASIDAASDNRFQFFGLLPLYSLFSMFCYYISTLFFILSEIYATTLFGFLLFAYFNSYTTIKQFKRFIPLILISANVGLFFSGLLFGLIISFKKKMNYVTKGYVDSTLYCGYAVVLLTAYFITRGLDKHIDNPLFEAPVIARRRRAELSTTETIKLLFSAKLVLGLSVIVLFYNIMVNLTEADYKASVKAYSEFYSLDESGGDAQLKYQQVAQIVTALSVIVLLLSPLKRSVDILGWTFVGLITPIIMTVGAITVVSLFLINYSFRNEPPNGWFYSLLRTILPAKNPEEDAFSRGFMNFSLWVACLTIAQFKTLKYAFFDVAKETLSMRIDPENRAKYKSVYDGMCGKVGKSISSLYIIVVNAILSTEDFLVGSFVLIPIFLVMSVVWFFLVLYIGRKYKESVERNALIDVDQFIEVEKPENDKEDK